jgi:acyl-CoA thioesterase-1
MQMVRNLGPAFTGAFGAIYPDIAKDAGLILIPFFLEGVAGRPDLNQDDGIHPTAEGYRRIVDHIYPYVIEAIERHRSRAEGRTPQ